jgi:hypothetical protein
VKALGLIFGHSAYAVATVLAVFMGCSSILRRSGCFPYFATRRLFESTGSD